jgi:tRNA A-37 threonylcarbamoyl transferase component Bud32
LTASALGGKLTGQRLMTGCSRKEPELEKVVFADGWQKYFEERGLECFDDIYDYPEGVVVDKNTKRNVKRITFEADGRGDVFFMKRFDRPHLKDMYFAFRNYGKAMSQGRLEWENARLLLENGIETYRPACYGEKLICGIERRSFLITRELSGVCLADFIAHNWNETTEDARERIVVELGAFVERICRAKMCLPDLYVWHIYIINKPGKTQGRGCRFAVIDLHRMSHDVRGERFEVENLARLHHSMRQEYFGEDLKRLLVQSYAQAAERDDVAELYRKVERRSRIVSAVRQVRSYHTQPEDESVTLSA